ncbi:MAG TPA: 4-hydroxybenzoate octaprenyltransferase, partial [Phycisphaerales bacterium]|nr:4-hydroxybenzoate octaprenyltransferase [Phycisphaerales bacterium]
STSGVQNGTDSDAGFWPALVTKVALIVLCMGFARTLAMLANRFLDRKIDALNPRTASRALPSGRLSPNAAVLFMAGCAAAFVGITSLFGFLYHNWLPLILSVPVLGWLCGYGYLKRFTALCHIYLGASLAISPIAAAIAINPHTLSPGSAFFQPAIFLLSFMVVCWVAGFDVIYALQDVEVDREQHLYSIPARLGVPRAILISRLLHMLAFAALVIAWKIDPRFSWPFAVGVGCTGILLLIEHLTVARWGRTKIALTFFTLNGIISCVLGILGIIDMTVV